MPLVGNFGPAGLPSALVLTIDNLGEARALERGTKPADEPVGNDPSVTVALPWLLDELDAHGLGATFFVEAINCELYPDAVRQIAARGHELGLHGWRHEEWASLSAADEREILTRAVGAFAGLGIGARGFRPPGGELNSRSPALLREAGLRWCSPAGGTAGVRRGLAYVPFAWNFVDAYHLMDSFAPLRVARGDPGPSLEPGVLADQFEDELQELAVTGSLRTLARERRTWVVTGGAFADWLMSTGAALTS